MATEAQVRNLMDCFAKLVQALRSPHRAAEHLHTTGAQLFVLKVIGHSDVPLTIAGVAEQRATDQSTVSVVATSGTAPSHRTHAHGESAEQGTLHGRQPPSG
jgi:hypothetical protein